MTFALSRPMNRDATRASQSVPAQSLPQTAKSARRGWRRRKGFVIATGVIVASLISAIIWRENYPAAQVQAEEAYRNNRLAVALQISLEHLKRRPTSRYSSLLAARCLSRLGRPDQAEPLYEKAGTLDLDDQHIRAYALVLSNRRESAIRAYKRILEIRPDDVLALRRLAAVLISERRWDGALDAANRLIKVPAGAVVGHTLAGVVHHNARDSELAVFAFTRVLELDPELKQMPLKPPSMFWAEFGHNLLAVGRWAEARKCLNHAREESNDPKIADLLGQSFFVAEEFDEAERWWRMALEQDPDRYGTWWRIGKLELQRGRLADAIKSLRRASELEPNAAGPLYSLALIYRRLGQKEEADRVTHQLDRLRAGPATASHRDDDTSALDGSGGIAR
jgi:tetratricopeptide (TPR) repeat protein